MMNKERLQKYKAIKREKDQLLALSNMLKERERETWAVLTSMTVKQGDGTHGQGKTTPDDKIVNLIHRREQLSQSIKELIQQYTVKVAEMDAELLAIEQAIKVLGPAARTLLRYRYIDGMKWEDICVKMNYSWRQTHRLHGEALQKLNEKTE